jgi:hypothetical protein
MFFICQLKSNIHIELPQGKNTEIIESILHPPLVQCTHTEWQVFYKTPIMTSWLSVLLLSSFFPKPVKTRHFHQFSSQA